MKMKNGKKGLKWLVTVGVFVLLSAAACLPVFAAGELYYDFRDNELPNNWRLNDISVIRNNRLEVTTPSDKFAEARLPKPYLSGDVVIEFDFMTDKSDAMNFYVQNPNGGSVFRIQHVKNSTTVQVQHSKGDGTGNENTAIYKKFQNNTWYHVKAIINYHQGEEKQTKSSVYLYDADGNLLGSAENKLYMDAKTRANPTNLQICMMNMPATVSAEGATAYFDNIAVYQDTDASAVEATLLTLHPADGIPISESITLPTAGYRGSVVTWQSSNPSVLAEDGTIVKLPETDTVVTLTATVRCGEVSKNAAFPVTVAGLDAPEVYYWNFNDDQLPDGFHSTNPAKAGVHNRRLEFAAGSESDNRMTINLEEVKYGYGAASGKFFVEFDFTTTTTAAEICCIQAAPNTGSLIRLEQTGAEAGVLVTGGTGGAENVSTSFALEQGKDYHAKLYLDYTDKICSVYLNDTVIAENHAFMNTDSPDALRDITLRNGLQEGEGILAVDNVVIYRTDSASAVLATQLACQLDTEKVVTTSVPLPKTGYNGVAINWISMTPSLIDNEGRVVSTSFQAAEAVLQAEFAKGNKTETKLFQMKVAKTPLAEISGYRLDTSNGTKVDCQIKNTTTAPLENAFAIMAVYQGTKLVECVVKRVTLPVGEKNSISVTAVQTGDNVKLYVWDENMIPLCSPYQ